MLKNRKTPSRIELHRLKHRWSQQRGKKIPLHSLSIQELSIISEDVLATLKTRKEDPYKVLIDVLFSWGISCPHPQYSRLYSGKIKSYVPLSDYSWYDCSLCGCSCINEDKEDR